MEYNAPLAVSVRPDSIDFVAGQKHILGEGKILRIQIYIHLQWFRTLHIVIEIAIGIKFYGIACAPLFSLAVEQAYTFTFISANFSFNCSGIAPLACKEGCCTKKQKQVSV